jgi:hypothetical protein
MIRILYRNIILLFVFFLFIGCEEIIQVDLDNSEPKIVIEATISNNSNDNLVIITRSTDFYNPSEYEPVNGANIVVSDGDGNSYSFMEIESGRYINTELIPQVGITYNMTVETGNEVYTAFSAMQEPIILDSITVVGEKTPFRDELFYEYNAYFQDNPGQEDYARFKVYINGVMQTGIFRYDDRLTDGNYIDFNRFFFEPKEDIVPGDTVTIEMLTIDKITFEYFDTLRRVIASGRGPFGSTSPSNPITNWSNNALGYFSAYSMNSKSTIIE